MMRRPKDRSEPESTVQQMKKVIFKLGDPCSALCTNRDGTLLAAVGRRVFKIFKLSPDQFEVVHNLRDLPHKHINLNYSSNDVQWNPRDDAQLATAPTNGSVVLWDINKRTKSKLAHAFEGCHQRAVNKLSFHPREANILLSGSQDSTMNVFDIRQKNVVATYKGPDCVRDVQFPGLQVNDNYFAACFDNGMLYIWDRRRDNPMKQISIHYGPAYCCAWHPEQEHWIMSAGRDKMIKVYDLQQGRPKEIYTVHAPFSVARAKWRPGHKYHITSCSHFLDNAVQIWDVRRPYIPFGSFVEHTDDVTDFLWRNEQVLLTCSKDGKVIQQLFSNAQRPAERATPVGLSYCPDGSLAHACSDSVSHKSKTAQNSSQSRHSLLPMSFRKAEQDPYQESFLLHTSSLKEQSPAINKSKVDPFTHFAKSYKLHGLPMHELCDHNYKVAHSLGKQDVAQTWLILKLLYCGTDIECSRLGLVQIKMPSRHTAGSRLSNVQPLLSVLDTASESHTPGGPGKESATESRVHGLKDAISTDSAQEDNEDEGEENNPADAVNAVLDFFEDDQDSELDPSQNLVHHPQQVWGELPVEPFQLRDEILQRPPSPEHDASSAVSTSHSAVESSSSVKQHPLDGMNLVYSKQSSLVKSQWDFTQVVGNMLKFYAEQGDVQMSVSALLVLGERGTGLLEEKAMEQWFSSYIDLLVRRQLWSVAALIIKLSSLPEISEMSQAAMTRADRHRLNLIRTYIGQPLVFAASEGVATLVSWLIYECSDTVEQRMILGGSNERLTDQSTLYHIGCGNCNKAMDTTSGWQCSRCEKVASLCSVCHSLVKGLFVWCQVCGHGGHLHHMQDWFKKNKQCPTGCGHNCMT